MVSVETNQTKTVQISILVYVFEAMDVAALVAERKRNKKEGSW